jgi:hypothetical protein
VTTPVMISTKNSTQADFFLSVTKAVSGYYFCSCQKIVPQNSTTKCL